MVDLLPKFVTKFKIAKKFNEVKKSDDNMSERLNERRNRKKLLLLLLLNGQTSLLSQKPWPLMKSLDTAHSLEGMTVMKIMKGKKKMKNCC